MSLQISLDHPIDHCPEDLLPGKYIRSRDELLSADYQPINDRMLVVLDYLSNKVMS